MSKNTMSKPVSPAVKPAPKKPNEMGSISVEAFVKISDPITKQVFVEKRA
jgi:hypothetical protein